MNKKLIALIVILTILLSLLACICVAMVIRAAQVYEEQGDKRETGLSEDCKTPSQSSSVEITREEPAEMYPSTTEVTDTEPGITQLPTTTVPFASCPTEEVLETTPPAPIPAETETLGNDSESILPEDEF